MFCQKCGIEAPTKYVAFYQNIGLLVMRLSKSIEGNLCKSCIHKTFWSFTAVNLTLGWWGMISLILTPCFVVNNLVRYLLCLGMPAVPFDATVPQLNEQVYQRLQPHVEQIFGRLNAGEEFQRVAEDTAMRAGVTPGQVALYVRALIDASQRQH